MIERICPACGGVGWRGDYPPYVEDLTCNECKGNKVIHVPASEATDEELDTAIAEAWDACSDAHWEADEHALRTRQDAPHGVERVNHDLGDV